MRSKQILPPESVTNQAIANRLVEGVITSKKKKPKMIWMELNGCSGNVISLLNGTHPDFDYMITSMVDLVYNNSVMAAEGERAIENLMNVLDDEEEFIFAVEGAVATKNNGLYNVVGSWKGEPLTGLKVAKMFGEKAKHVIAVGACASHGGISAAKPNPSESVGLQRVLERKVIKLPGCPCHPDWFLGTLAHLILYGEPELDHLDRPKMFYSTLIHDRCPRRPYFDRGIFAKKLGDKECLFKLGCRGPVTRIDCPTRQWNGYVNWPIEDNTPCIGCAQFGFPDQMAPFVRYDTTEEET
ncbi:hydrogenase small subunit [Metabacillus halosaccharovorans]|uniref:hydrogenase small subunit n=1 Tax=Metabacillus halosaccharovorans TaxID=930124 RepID=UPI003736CC64